MLRRADALLAWLEGASERDYIGEPVSQLAHALQCAAAARQAQDAFCKVLRDYASD